jgi:hypothetical protein
MQARKLRGIARASPENTHSFAVTHGRSARKDGPVCGRASG